jgi:hypothetical protein
VHDAELNVALGEDRGDGVGETGKPLDAGDEDVFYAAGIKVLADVEPELCPFGVRYPHAEHVLFAVEIDPDTEIDHLLSNRPAVTHFVADAVEVEHRIERLKPPVLPRPDLFDDTTSDEGQWPAAAFGWSQVSRRNSPPA